MCEPICCSVLANTILPTPCSAAPWNTFSFIETFSLKTSCGGVRSDTRVIAEMHQHVDVLEQFERALVIEEIGADEAVRHVVGVDDVRGEQIESRSMERCCHRAAESSGRPGDQHSRRLRADRSGHRSTPTTVRQTGSDTS